MLSHSEGTRVCSPWCPGDKGHALQAVREGRALRSAALAAHTLLCPGTEGPTEHWLSGARVVAPAVALEGCLKRVALSLCFSLSKSCFTEAKGGFIS